jgi:glycosyltransferase involved in cell wall biosynthesis
MYTRFLRKADLVLVTEECYVKFLNDHKINRVAVLHDRYLQKQHFRSRNTGTTLRLVTLGTISSSKNPINFIQVLTSRDTDFLYRYDIYGKSLDACGLVLHDAVKINSHIHYYDQYISDSEYISLLEKADFVVIPYDADYTKYMTSGVMWDCFERCKPIICPDVKLFRFYIEKYKIGFTYTDESLVGLIKELAENKAKITLELQCNFEILCGEISHENVSVKFKQCVSDLVAMGPCVST